MAKRACASREKCVFSSVWCLNCTAYCGLTYRGNQLDGSCVLTDFCICLSRTRPLYAMRCDEYTTTILQRKIFSLCHSFFAKGWVATEACSNWARTVERASERERDRDREKDPNNCSSVYRARSDTALFGNQEHQTKKIYKFYIGLHRS